MNNDTKKRTETHACDYISRAAAIEALYDVFFDDDLKAAYPDEADVVLDVIRKLPSAQPGSKELSFTHKALDTISRQAAITAIQKAYADTEGGTDKCAVWKNVGLTNALHIMQDLPSAQQEVTEEEVKEYCRKRCLSIIDNALLKKYASAQPDVSDTNVGDMISRRSAIDALDEIRHALWEIDIPSPTVPEYVEHHEQVQSVWKLLDKKQKELYVLPSAQSERTCVNCGRTVNNGGWYADGRTRCPIEEHYALPKDGYCHLWEKRNVTDDDCPERRTDEPEK